MTPELQRAAIAEACGWQDVGIFGGEPIGLPPGFTEDMCPEGADEVVPDYLNDLNAMHKAEGSAIDPWHIDEYAVQLNIVLERFWTPLRWVTFTKWGVVYAFSTATAAQRAEAFLRTIGKWKD